MNFAHITHINDVLPFVKDKPEFQHKWQVAPNGAKYQVIDYMLAHADSFDSPPALECRGIKFDEAGHVICRPLHKFFNQGEKPRTEEEVDECYEKMDGSMIAPMLLTNPNDPDNEQMYFTTRAGITDVAQQAMNENYSVQMCKWVIMLLQAKCQPIFEFISPTNQIVIRYGAPELVLTAIRDMYSGKYVDYNTLCEYAEKMGLRAPDKYHWDTNPKDWTDREGVVCANATGFRMKIKADDYVLKHKLKDGMKFEKDVLKLVLQGKVDDILSSLDPYAQAELKAYHKQVLQRVNAWADLINELAKATAKYPSRKDRAQAAQNTHPLARAVYFKIIDGHDATEALIFQMLRGTVSQKATEAMRSFIGPAWRTREIIE